jgi:hypothetical protein
MSHAAKNGLLAELLGRNMRNEEKRNKGREMDQACLLTSKLSWSLGSSSAGGVWCALPLARIVGPLTDTARFLVGRGSESPKWGRFLDSTSCMTAVRDEMVEEVKVERSSVTPGGTELIWHSDRLIS